MNRRIKFSAFVSRGSREYGESTITLDGQKVGILTRISEDEFVTASSRERQWRVRLYEVSIFDDDPGDVFDPEDDDMSFEVTTSRDAKAALRMAKAYARQKISERVDK
jgi:hypothetical protein